MSLAVTTSQSRISPQAGSGTQTLRHTILVSFLVSLSYYITAKAGFWFALQPGSVSTLWLPNSILLAGILVIPRKFWWVVVLFAFPAHLGSGLQSGVPTLMVLSWFVSNSAQALIGAATITYFLKDGPQFDKSQHLIIFLLCGAFLAPFLSSFLDIALQRLNGWGGTSYADIWRVRFFSNVLATLSIVPFIVGWLAGGLAALRKASFLRYLEAGLLMAGLVVVGVLVFKSQHTVAGSTQSILYWPLPFLLWAAVRFGPLGASSSLLVVMFLAITGATKGQGPFVNSSAAMNALSIQWFLIVVSIPLMSLATLIEERRRAEEKARSNEERLSLALDAAEMGTWDWDIVGRKVTLSETTRRMFGLTEDEPAPEGELFYPVIHPEDRDAVRAAVTNVLATGSSYEAEFRIVVDGVTRWLLGKGEVLYDRAGRPSRMLGVNVDITKRKIADQSLTEVNSRNQAILRAQPDMMFLVSRNGEYLDFYAGDPTLLATAPNTLIGKNVRDVLPADVADRVVACLRRLDDSDEIQVLEYSLGVAGEMRQFEARVVAAEGNKALSIVRDVTVERRAVEAVRSSEEKLQLSNQQIRKLAAQLMTAQESERRRIALLLHDDVGQNVATLGLSLSRLKRKLPGSPGEMVAELDFLSRQTNDLATQIRRLSHQLHPEVLEQLGLVAALESYVTEFGQAEKIDLKFTTDVGTEPIQFGLSVCLYRVALEALRNVSRHSGAKNASLSLKEDGDFLVLEVADSGKGFDVEKARQGSGIGLLSTEERVKLLKGSFEIRSCPQTGTVLSVSIPLGSDYEPHENSYR